jgi:hypothetical protein
MATCIAASRCSLEPRVRHQAPMPSARRANTSYPLGLKRALGLDLVAA